MTRRGFMGRLAVAAGVTALLPGVKATMPVGDAIVAGVDIGSQPVTWTSWVMREFGDARTFNIGRTRETDAEYVKRFQELLRDMRFQEAVKGNAIIKIKRIEA